MFLKSAVQMVAGTWKNMFECKDLRMFRSSFTSKLVHLFKYVSCHSKPSSLLRKTCSSEHLTAFEICFQTSFFNIWQRWGIWQIQIWQARLLKVAVGNFGVNINNLMCFIWKNCHNIHRQLLVSGVVWEYRKISVFSKHASAVRTALSVSSSSSWDGPIYSTATSPATVSSQFKQLKRENDHKH